MEERTKDYSKVYQEDAPPIPQIRRATKTLDGAAQQRRHRELGMGIDPHQLSSALLNLTAGNQKVFAINTLKAHYDQVFQKKPQGFKVYLIYLQSSTKREAYSVRVQKNTLREVKSKLPIKGNYRIFVQQDASEFEEVEDDEAALPYVEKDGLKIISCRLFTN